ncbi:hypothetical protein K440DRAFT_632318 [Wilcoxina mikolae CBS 423.85]|nr:hypothetical protein K440DRAFT_632318 [Wilcoxina mikolae CBS 423.85]
MPHKKNIRCKLCRINFSSAELRDAHIKSTPNHSSGKKPRCDCDICNPSLSNLSQQDPRRLYRPNAKGPRTMKCEPCDRSIFMCQAGRKKHKLTPLHVKNARRKNLYCADNRESFFSKANFDAHQQKNHQVGMQYHCTDCATDFPSKCALKRHPKNDTAHGKRAMGILCEPCGKTFASGSKYDAHLLTKGHRKAGKFKCFAYPECTRKFSTKGGMLSHLESGKCKSGLNRQKIDDVIRQHDTSNMILKVGAGSSSQTIQDAAPNHPTPAPAGSIEEVDADSDSDSDGGCTIILTPTTETSFSRRASFAEIHTPSSTLSGFATPYSYSTPSQQEGFSNIPTPSSALSGYSTPQFFTSGFVEAFPPGIFTPSSTLSGLYTPRSNITGFGEADFQFAFGNGRVCYICNRTFSSPKVLQIHLDSLAHAPRIYKCPTFLFVTLPHSEKPHRDFKSLSGLVMHLESGACKGGKEALEKAIGFVEEKLNGKGRGLLEM